ncbi:MAG: hypothetical protein QG635_2118 [Bacteroidota bacterium]|nr:hypothetical protein [Bacteroidota bacterium]
MQRSELKSKFLKSEITKPEYILSMYDKHKELLEYAEFIKNTDIAKIEITDSSIVMTTREMNIRLTVDFQDRRIIPLEILNFDSYEKAELDSIVSIMKKNMRDGFTFLDIGANIGWYSINLGKKFPDINIYSFEPIPKTFGYLKNNIEANNISNARINNFGFSEKKDTLKFYYYPEESGNASLANLSGSANVEEITCNVMKADDFARENNLKIDFIKCDVEGAELFVFKGAEEILRESRPIIFSEMLRKWSAKFDYHPNDMIDYFKSLDYQTFVIDESGSLKEFGLVDENTKETNYYFIPIEKISNCL